MPKQLVQDVLLNPHGEFGRHPGITKAKKANTRKYYHPNMAKIFRERVMSCMQCIKTSRIDIRLTRLPLQNLSEHITGPEDSLKNNSVPKMPLSGF